MKSETLAGDRSYKNASPEVSHHPEARLTTTPASEEPSIMADAIHSGASAPRQEQPINLACTTPRQAVSKRLVIRALTLIPAICAIAAASLMATPINWVPPRATVALPVIRMDGFVVAVTGQNPLVRHPKAFFLIDDLARKKPEAAPLAIAFDNDADYGLLEKNEGQAVRMRLIRAVSEQTEMYLVVSIELLP